MNRALAFVFLDGVGIGPGDPARNPFLSARLPTLDRLLGGVRPTLENTGGGVSTVGSVWARVLPLDANLDTEGRPQSGTGQTALLTGLNAAERFGRHFGPWTPVDLRPVLAEHNLLRRAVDLGLSTAFANAYPDGYLERVSSRRVAAPPLAAHSAGLLNRHHGHLARGEAVASGIVNHGWIRHLGHDVPVLTPRTAGHNLAAIAARHDLTFYAHYDTDKAGHSGDMGKARRALERVDEFLDGVLEGLPPHGALVLASDHGNIEYADGKHTRNPVMGLVAMGNAAHKGSLARVLEGLDGARSIMDVRDGLLRVLMR